MIKIYKLILVVLIGFVLFLVAGQLFYKNQKTINLQSSSNSKEIVLPSLIQDRLGQSFIVGIEGKILDDRSKQILEKIKPAGVILYYRNFESPNQLKELISQLQLLAIKTTNHPYFIMIDEEPGGATRLDLFENVFAFGTPNWQQIESDIKIMKSLGVNVDLAPIADFAFDDNAFIKDRVPARSIDNLKDFNKKFISLLSQNNILSTLKHFPGMGVFVEDPHKVLPSTDIGILTIDKSIDIFKNGIDNGADFVMTCHCVYDDIDPDNPATTSKIITTDILRKQVGFNGLIITDDLSEMPFTINKKIDLSQATSQAIKAGNNLVLFSHKLTETEIIFDKLLNIVKNDKELSLLVGQNYIKVVSLKNSKFEVSK